MCVCASVHVCLCVIKLCLLISMSMCYLSVFLSFLCVCMCACIVRAGTDSVCFCLFVCLQKGPFCAATHVWSFCVRFFFFSFAVRSHLIVCTWMCVCPLYRSVQLFVHGCSRGFESWKFIFFVAVVTHLCKVLDSFHTLIVCLFTPSSLLRFSALVRCGSCASENMSDREKN